MKNSLVGFCYFFASLIAFAQSQKQHPKGHFVDSLNRYYQQASLPLYVFVSTSPDGELIPLSPEDNDKKANTLKPIYLDGHGKHVLRHFDALHSHADNFIIYADGIAPVSKVSFSMPESSLKHTQGNDVYYGKNLSVFLSAQDEMSGVKELYYSVNGSDYQPYTGVIRFDSEGEQTLRFYAVDNVGNAEKPQTFRFTVDTDAPQTYHNFIGINSQNIISLSTKIYLTMEDNFSGVKKTFYYFDNEKPKNYVPETNIDFSYLKDGEHTLYYYSIDEVNN
ncbi:MAG: chitobiase/beta-hexosaminidase C-terminal domain-containing protein, partial [Flammeovirgaceae bacterium]|nr:chitobiase/beta-hexosaminidase C-terminal domain-containing protein [Flammeovirgaceae bacterium]MDW8288771.1 chitobiase/beta-hexosaminidase C-terminal domain-containing protein [Flammeovirgaceae bacterium]